MIMIFCYVFHLSHLLIIELFDLYVQPLHAKAPSFIGDKRINLSWKEATKTAPTTTPAVGYYIRLYF
jgi:hypothetical protein